MMRSPMNQLPADPDWVRLVDAITEQAANQLKCMVIVIAMQEAGKLSFSVDGVPGSGPLAMLAEDYPRLLEILALALRKQEAHDREESRQ